MLFILTNTFKVRRGVFQHVRKKFFFWLESGSEATLSMEQHGSVLNDFAFSENFCFSHFFSVFHTFFPDFSNFSNG